jgi:hypothetical protein
MRPYSMPITPTVSTSGRRSARPAAKKWQPPRSVTACEVAPADQESERARDPDAHGHERLKPEPEAKLRQDDR